MGLYTSDLLPMPMVYIDDILITGPTIEEHLSTLDEVLEKLGVANLRLNKPKCFSCNPALST